MRSFLFILALTIFATAPVMAITWRVPDDAPTIQAGIDMAAAGDTVMVACGTYYEHDIVMKAGITLRGDTGLAGCVIIDAQQLGRVILCQDLDLEATVWGLTLTGGNMPENDSYGGGLLCENSLLRVFRCDFVGNYSGYLGGGLASIESDPEISHCRFLDNEGYMGGGGIYCSYSEAQISHCDFERNVGIDGAGLYCNHASPSVEWCVFLENNGMVWGGAILAIHWSSPAISQCTMVGNDAHEGAGITTIYYSYPTLENTIIAFNTRGEGVHCYDDFGDSTYAYLTCCDVYGNEGGSYTGWIEDQTGINGNIAEDPIFCDIEIGDLTLSGGSPCLPAFNDCNVLMGALSGGCSILGLEDTPPAVCVLHQNHPNPFNPMTTIGFDLANSEHVELRVFDLAGRLVRVLEDGTDLPAGSHGRIWNGKDDRGRAVTSGAYIYRLQAGEFMASGRMVLVR